MAVPLLTLGSTFWVVALTLLPTVRESMVFLVGTCVWLVANGVLSWIVLFREKRLLFVVNVVQVLLFALLFCQIDCVLGRQHYRVMEEPSLSDWQWFAWSHALSAADLLHLLSGYGLGFNAIEHRSPLVSVLLVVMHLHVSVYIVGLLARRVLRLLSSQNGPTNLMLRRRWKERLQFAFLIGMAVVGCATLLTASLGRWPPLDWFLWPIEQALRTLDLGGVFEIFRWRLHSLDASLWPATLGLAFRVVVGFMILSALHAWMLRHLGVLAPRPLDDFVDGLMHPQDDVRAAAAEALGQIGPPAQEAVPVLVLTVEDLCYHVGRASRNALVQIGPAPAYLVPELIGELRHSNWAIRRSAVEALKKIGPPALAAVPLLVEMLADDDPTIGGHVEAALHAIYPGWEQGSLACQAIPPLIRKLNHPDRRIRQQAADVLGRLGESAFKAVPALMRAAADAEEYVRLSATWALDRIEPSWKETCFVRTSLLEEAGLSS